MGVKTRECYMSKNIDGLRIIYFFSQYKSHRRKARPVFSTGPLFKIFKVTATAASLARATF